jgi:small-conductance mechanosensitive channel
MNRELPPFLLLHRIDPFIQLEPLIMIIGLTLGSFFTAKLFLRHTTQERLTALSGLFSNVMLHTFGLTGLFISYSFLITLTKESGSLERLIAYIGLLVILEGAIVFVKTLRTLLFQYLFLSYRNVAFPLLLVNLFTLLLSLLLASWLGTEIFNLKIAPLLATSAIFSLVLGLALQDTLGNLFAGVSIQIDKPYQLGDWIEIQNNGQKLVGQVYDITWRATLLLAFSEELITVPNRVMANSQILNFSSKFRPIARGHAFRFYHDVDVARVKSLLPSAIKTIPSIKRHPAPSVSFSEVNDQGVLLKLSYFIDNFGEQFRVADLVLSRCLETLREAGIPLAVPHMRIAHREDPEKPHPSDLS